MKTLKISINGIILLSIMLISGSAFSQLTNMQEVVYLKNGSVIHGVIVEQVPNKSLTIETRDKNKFVFKLDEIEKITKEINVPENEIKIDKNDPKALPVSITDTEKEVNNSPPFKSYGSFTTEMGYLSGTGDISSDEYIYSTSGDVESGIQNNDGGYFFKSNFSQHVNGNLSFGAGLELDFYEDKTLMPLFMSIQVNASNPKTQPYFNFCLGHAVSGDVEGGLMVDLNFGIRFINSEDHAFGIGMSYRSQHSDVTIVNGNDKITIPATSEFLSFTIGYTL